MLDKYRILLFIFLCFPVRILIAFFAKILQNNSIKNKYLQISTIKYIFSLFTLIIGISFINNWFINKQVSGFGGKVWWQNLRLIHGINFILYSILSIMNIKNAYKLLFMDVLMGLLSFILNYFV